VYELSIRTRFSAAHHLNGYPGQCASVHGHNWDVEVFVRGRSLNSLGMLVDFRVLKAAVSAAAQDLDHRNLNDLGPFCEQNPTSENIARWLFDRLSGSLKSPDFAVSRVRVHETPDASATYEADMSSK
jgi:6-pyruvoyltetrahydropterin/6-carboxytetrahydropterin synthase